MIAVDLLPHRYESLAIDAVRRAERCNRAASPRSRTTIDESAAAAADMPGLELRSAAFRASSTSSYSARCSAVYFPLTGIVLVMSAEADAHERRPTSDSLRRCFG